MSSNILLVNTIPPSPYPLALPPQALFLAVTPLTFLCPAQKLVNIGHTVVGSDPRP